MEEIQNLELPRVEWKCVSFLSSSSPCFLRRLLTRHCFRAGTRCEGRCSSSCRACTWDRVIRARVCPSCTRRASLASWSCAQRTSESLAPSSPLSLLTLTRAMRTERHSSSRASRSSSSTSCWTTWRTRTRRTSFASCPPCATSSTDTWRRAAESSCTTTEASRGHRPLSSCEYAPREGGTGGGRRRSEQEGRGGEQRCGKEDGWRSSVCRCCSCSLGVGTARR